AVLKRLRGKILESSKKSQKRRTAGWEEALMISGHAVSLNPQTTNTIASLQPRRLVIQATKKSWTGLVWACGYLSNRLSEAKMVVGKSCLWRPRGPALLPGSITRASLALLTFAFCAIPVSAFGQGFRATIVGRVTDQSGAVVSKVKIVVTNVGTNESRTAETNDTGDYTVPQLVPGEYTLTAEQTGFRKEVVRRLVLETNQQLRVDVALTTGAITEQVEVQGIAPLVISENASLGNVVDQKKVVELPLNGRDYLQLAQLQPNVFAPAQGSTVGFRGGFNVAGNSEIANNYMKDGIDNNDETTNQPLHRPILDAVREFKVL